MRFLILLFFILCLLPVGALAHDLYLAYQDAQQSNVQFGDKPLRFSDIGWLWIQYSPDTYDWARRGVNPETWRRLIDPVLGQTALIATLVPPALIGALIVVLKLLKNTALGHRMGNAGKGGISLHGDKSKGRVSYKRK
jgi:hypothetical protein